jgi:hypothetical protein
MRHPLRHKAFRCSHSFFTCGNKWEQPNPQKILRIEMLASYVHEIAHSAAACTTAGYLFPLFPQGQYMWEHGKALCHKGCRMFPLFPQKTW